MRLIGIHIPIKVDRSQNPVGWQSGHWLASTQAATEMLVDRPTQLTTQHTNTKDIGVQKATEKQSLVVNPTFNNS